MKTLATPSSYLDFLESDLGNILHRNLLEAIEKVKPFKIRAYGSLLIGFVLALLVFLIFRISMV